MPGTKSLNEVPHHLEAIASVLRTISQKLTAAADGFEEFQVRGSALRHMGVSIDCMADQFDRTADAFRQNMPSAATSNFTLISSLISGSAFQLKHFGLSLATDHHHMVPMCGAHNPRSPVAESAFLWSGISEALSIVAEILDHNLPDTGRELAALSSDILKFSQGLAEYRDAMEDSNFELAAEHLGAASELLAEAAISGSKFSAALKTLSRRET